MLEAVGRYLRRGPGTPSTARAKINLSRGRLFGGAGCQRGLLRWEAVERDGIAGSVAEIDANVELPVGSSYPVEWPSVLG
jgi:hypothetical protein